MSFYSGSVRSFHDEDESTPLNEKLDNFDSDTASEGEACPRRRSGLRIRLLVASSVAIRCAYKIGWLPILAITPSFLQPASAQEHRFKRSNTLHATAYLDGMRGLAAFAVFLCHLSYTTFDISHVYGAGEDGEEDENKNLLQLPIVRLFYSGPPMVAIFFVISGYALSYKPLKQMRKRDFDGLVRTLCSSTFRRGPRLFLPCFASTLIVVSLCRLGLYKLNENFANDVRAIHEVHYWTAPDLLSQVADWAHKMFDLMNVFDWSLYAGANDIDPHLWTIPVEFRCSMALFVTHLLIARMTARTRRLTMAILMIWGTYWGRWEMVPFWSGMALAELDLTKVQRGEEMRGITSHDHIDCTRDRSLWRTCLDCIVLVSGLYIASYPDADGHVSPGFIWLTRMIPDRYAEKHRFWGNVGAVMVVWSISNLHHIRQAFTTSVLQYLGKISFPLYVCHGFVIHGFTYWSLDKIWEATNAYDDWDRFIRGFVVVALCTIVVTIWVSDVFFRLVDARCVKFARWLERRVFAQ